MKTLYVVLTLLIISQLSFAAIQKETKYVVVFQKEKFSFSPTKTDPSEGLKEFAQNCFNNFTRGGRTLSHDAGLDMINACANPRLVQ